MSGGVNSPRTKAGATGLRIAIVGSGPRGLAVLERLAVRLCEQGPGARIDIHLIDAVDVGAGRIWRPGQPDHFIVNTVAGEVSAFSGGAEAGPARPGAGPSFYDWWRARCPSDPGPNSYPPRALYGRYLHEVLAAIEVALQSCGATLHRTQAQVLDLERVGPHRLLRLADGRRLEVERVVLATGHPRPPLPPAGPASSDMYIAGDSAADMALEQIGPGTPVGVLGLGLGFYDIMAALTLGRGGRFAAGADGLQYVPSGREPVLYAGSRSATPVQSRGRNQKATDHRYTPAILTHERLQSLHRPGHTDLRIQVLPLLQAEVNLVYLETHLRRHAGAGVAQALRERVVHLGLRSVEELQCVAGEFGLADLGVLDLQRLANPFADATFSSAGDFTRALLAHLSNDVSEAALGNVDSPLKAALDVLRDVRNLLRPLIDFGGLHPQSHRRDVVEWYSPVSSLLAAGPPAWRTQQLMALMRAGHVLVIGPQMQFSPAVSRRGWHVVSPRVHGSGMTVDVMIDTRIPVPDIRQDPSPLTRALLARGHWRPFVNRGAGVSFETGGVDITHSPYHPIDRSGKPDLQMHVLGIPCEHIRWFTQVGSTRPGQWTDFVADADAIASHLLQPIAGAARVDLSPPRRHDCLLDQPNAA